MNNMNILFFDVETTGKINRKAPASARMQPRIVQLGALLEDQDGNKIEEFSAILKCDGIPIPAEAAGIHGITDRIAAEKGLPRKHCMARLADLTKRAGLVVGHNIEFDSFMVEIEICHLGPDVAPTKGLQTFCTMQAATPLCKIPSPYGYSDFKWPKLEEAYKILCGKELTGAHDALADVMACREVYREILRRSVR